jgi:hypothetical protein
MTAALISHTHFQAHSELITECRNTFEAKSHDEVLARASWRTFSRLMAARRSIRVWCAESGRFTGVSRLPATIPGSAAAVPIYTKTGRTRMLVFDLDSRGRDITAVDADFCRIIGWLNECGARWIADLSASGGVHILVPLESSMTAEDVRPLMRAMASRCPTLDKTPMLNPRTGSISVPGSRCREGGFRVLIGGHGESTAVFYERNRPEVVAQLAALVMVDAVAGGYVGKDLADVTITTALPGHLLRDDPLPEAVLDFAVCGRMPADTRWQSRSEARMSVLVHAMWRGASLSDVRRQMSPGQPWRGMAEAYAIKKRGAASVARADVEEALRRDWAAAHHWHQERSRYFQTVTHKTQHTRPVPAPPAVRHWLAHATHWCDTTFRSSLVRWSVAAVLQALAVCTARTVQRSGGSLQLAVGGRGLSLAAGMLSASTVWSTLRLLRELDGSPVRLVEKGFGAEADTYVLVTPDVVDRTPDAAGRPSVSGVHPAWSVLGWQHRRVYETVLGQGLHTVSEVAAAARVSSSSAYESIAELCRCGLLSRSRGWVGAGRTTLDEIAARVGLERTRRDRIAGYRAARRRWMQWLAERAFKRVLAVVGHAMTRTGHVFIDVTLTATEYDEYLADVMRHEPPRELYGPDRCRSPGLAA